MKKFLSIILAILMVVTMLPMAIMPASAAYDYDETAKISFKITNLVIEWKGETEELGEYGSGFYEQSLTKVADGKYKYTYKAALSSGGGTWWSDPKTVTFDGVDCESDYYKTFDFTESTSVGGYTMTWTYTLEVKRYKGHTYSAWSDNGDGTHTRTCVINSAHKETASHNYAAATCSAPETCKDCGATQGESVADAHGWNAATCVLPQTCKYCGITQGEVLGHNMVAATFGKPAACSRCGATDINISVLEAALINTNVNLPSKAVKDDNAGYNDITWSVVDAGSTGATINGNTLKASYSGEAVIRATIESGSKDFTVLFKNSENIDISLGSVTVSQKDASTLTVTYAGFDGGSKDYMVGEPIQITGTTTSNYVEVSSGSPNIVLSNVSIDVSGTKYACAFKIATGASVDLQLEGANTLKSGEYYAGMCVVSEAGVAISGNGVLNTTGGDFGAGIGGAHYTRTEGATAGRIVINDGTINATGGTQGAGIGGGQSNSQVHGGTIIINGGTVVATGTGGGAGIGGGTNCSGGNITINGGTITATTIRTTSAAAIGGGYNGNGGVITITGGTITATSNSTNSTSGGAGIGGSNGKSGGTINITGGNIKAAGRNGADAIGNGRSGSGASVTDGNGNDLSLQTITLSGAAANTAVTATEGITYGLTDVKTLDTNKLYFYLPAESVADSFTAGGTVYDCSADDQTYYASHDWSKNDGVCARCGEDCEHENQTGETCEICGASLHTCDFSGEWKYDADKHWKECTADDCDKISEEAEHTFTDGKCDCGYICTHGSYTDGVCDKCDYECAHNYGEGVLTRPERVTTTDWDDGYYTYTCSVCDHYYQEAVKRADYSAYDAVYADYYAVIMNSSVLNSAKNELKDALDSIYQQNSDVMSGDRIESEQAEVDKVVAELEKIIADADEKIASGEYVKADYTEIDEAIADIEEKLADENITDEGKAGLEEIKKQLEEMKADENTSEADLAELEKELEAYEEELDKGIEDGTLVEVDGSAILVEYNNECAESLIEKYGEKNYNNLMNSTTDEVVAEAMDIEKEFAALTGTVAENEEKIAELKERFKALFDVAELCLAGTHSYKYEVTSPAKCEVNAKETGTCGFCGATDEREVEGTALTHSFTKYEETEAPKCGVAGKKKATCDNGCGVTDEKEIAALRHSFLDYASNGDATCTADGTKTAECANGCGATDTVADKGTMLDHADEDGDKICDDCQGEIKDVCPDCGGPVHEETGISQYICVIIMFIKLVVSFVKMLQGAA